MATTSIYINAPASAVYAALMDPWTYVVWVRGTKRIRDVDPGWPAPGTRFHHSVGVGPLTTRDETRMVECQSGRMVELEMHLWPVGQGRVRLELEEREGRTHVVMHEQFEKGPAAWADNAVQQALIKLRNDWSLDQLRKIVEQRSRMSY